MLAKILLIVNHLREYRNLYFIDTFCRRPHPTSFDKGTSYVTRKTTLDSDWFNVSALLLSELMSYRTGPKIQTLVLLVICSFQSNYKSVPTLESLVRKSFTEYLRCRILYCIIYTQAFVTDGKIA